MFSIRSKLIILFGGTALLVSAVVVFFGMRDVILFEKLREAEVRALFLTNVQTLNHLAEKFEFGALAIGAGANLLNSFRDAVPQRDIEGDVRQFLTSTYVGLGESVGGGFWFEPHEFDPSKIWYGPYVYRNGDKWDLTWDYNTPTYNYLKQDWYTIALPESWDRTKRRDKDEYWTAPYLDEVSKITMVTVDTFIYNSQGKILGLATSDWGLDSILNQLDQNRVTPGTESFMVDLGSGKIVLYTPDNTLKLKQRAKVSWLNDLIVPTEQISKTTTTLKDKSYLVYYTKTHNGYLYGIMVPEEEFMPEVWAVAHYSEISLVIVFALMLALMIIMYRSIAEPVDRIANTVQKIGIGDYAARTDLVGTDELSQLGYALDRMLDERVNSLVETERDKDNLSNSVIKLLEAVSQLSQRDLTIKVPVTEDVTGPVADALNLLTEETSVVLKEVTRISEAVASASKIVKNQSDAVIVMAEQEREAVDKTTVELTAAAHEMQDIARLAQTCNSAAETTIETTQAALRTVTNTVEGINSTRDTIRETEKRIKRLGERSQDITGVVNLINTIAERTHILALNASMHAASAGQAGRGFAVVANEVQRLAENAREATSRIATLVSNIQIETVDTANAINAAINQVIDGSRLAELAGEQMKRTQETTAVLVEGVRQIAERSQDQARSSVELVARAQHIQEGTQQTSQQLQEQTVHTDRLSKFAQELVDSVRVFKLPN